MDTTLFYSFLILLMLVACGLIYLSCKQQGLLAEPIAVAPWRYLAYLLLISALAGWHVVLTPAAAFFWWLLLLGLMLAALPLLSLLKQEPLK
ncbi:hypothetical protein HR45_15195 [Shewanella mangrovi]|uniref:Uncharacterized protein n=1 Tax=Shewanella mangrovi TaxID=1515746 RepID=A0A094J9P0_9GAMM|nr:hypothetical protein [Shewanella mangrovi]KFZ36640.1 hypothetical protein HR45_15195 [Shewanella mangrovi]